MCYTCVNRHYLTISKGLLVLWSVLGWLSLHPQPVQCVSSEATGRGSRFPSGHRGHRGSQGVTGGQVTAGAPRFPSGEGAPSSAACPAPAAAMLGAAQGAILWREGGGGAATERRRLRRPVSFSLGGEIQAFPSVVARFQYPTCDASLCWVEMGIFGAPAPSQCTGRHRPGGNRKDLLLTPHHTWW